MNPMDPNQPYQPQPQPASQPIPTPFPAPPAAPPQPYAAAPAPMAAPAAPVEPQPFTPQPNMQPAQPAPAPNPFAAPVQPPSPFAPHSQSQPMAQMPPQQPQPAMPIAHHGTNSRPPIMIIAVVAGVLLLAGAGAASYFLFFNQNGSGPAGLLGNIGGTPDVMDRPDGTLDLSNLIDTDKTIKNQSIKAKIKQQVSLSDGLTYMVTAVERNYVSSSKYFKPNAGKEFVRVSFVVGNRDKKTSLYLSSSQFKAKNSAGGLRAAEYATDEDVADAMVAQEIDGGKQVKGSYVFQVDKGETFSIVTNQEYVKLGSDGQKATLASEVSL